MNRFIRWQGLVIFFTVVSIVAAFILVFAEPLLKDQLVKQAEKINKAEVNIGQVNIHYFPFGLSLNNVQVTNAKQATENLVSFELLTAKVDLWRYWFGKTIIDDLSIAGLTLDQKRENIGQIYKEPSDFDDTENEISPEKSNQEQEKSASSSLPDVESVLSDSNLQTVKNSQRLQASYKSEKEKLAKVKADLPNEDDLAVYQEKLKQLSKRKIKSTNDLKQLKSDFKTLKSQFKQDKKAIKAAQAQISLSKKQLLPLITALKNSPEEDWQHIETTYQQKGGGNAAIAGILFGDKAEKYLKYLDKAYGYIEPYIGNDDKKEASSELDKVSGRFIHFDEHQPLPEFLLRKALIDIALPEGDFSLVIDNLTHQHWILAESTQVHLTSTNAGSRELSASQKPLTDQLQATNKAMTGQVDIHYNFSLTDTGQYNSKGRWEVNQYPLTNVDLVDEGKFNIVLKSSIFKGTGKLTNEGQLLDSSHAIVLSNTHYEGQADSSLQRSILKVLQSSNELTADFIIDGEVRSPNMDISSSIDDVFMEGLRQESKQKLAEFKGKVQAGLNEKLTQSLNLNEQEFQQLTALESSISDQDKFLDNLLSSDVIKDKGDELKDKLKDKLKGKLKKLF